MDLPLVSFGSVFHIDTMNPADKGSRGSSLEGHGLSFAASEELCETWKRLLHVQFSECPSVRTVDAAHAPA